MGEFVYAWYMARQGEEVRGTPVLKETVVRLTRPEERPLWDRLMHKHHYLGFRQFAGRGLRYVVEWEGQWLALLGWQTGVFQCMPRDRWLGWHKAVHFRRLHLIGNNTRFLVLPAGKGIRNLASRALGLNLQRLSADWQEHWGHSLELAETFVDPQEGHRGTSYLASNWIQVGLSKGYARSNGQYTRRHGKRKKMFVYPLRADARERLAGPQEQEEWRCRGARVQYGEQDLRSLRELLEAVDDPRGSRGKRHPLGVVLALLVLARVAGKLGGRAAERFSKTLKDKELRLLGCRRNRETGRFETPSDTTFQRVMACTDPESLERVMERWMAPRTPQPKALAGDGKRIRGRTA